MTRMGAASVLRAVTVSVAYLIVWIGLDLLARGYDSRGAVIPWYPGVAVTFYLFYTFGARYIYLPLVAEFLRSTLFTSTNHMAPISYVELGAIQASGYALVATIMRDR